MVTRDRLHYFSTDMKSPQDIRNIAHSNAHSGQKTQQVKITASSAEDRDHRNEVNMNRADYPRLLSRSDDELCQIFLEQNCWKVSKGDLVNNLQQSMGSLHSLHPRNPQLPGNWNRNSEWDIPSRGTLHLTTPGKSSGKEIM
ncbi:unnamed protein product [Lepidochelys kempii]